MRLQAVEGHALAFDLLRGVADVHLGRAQLGQVDRHRRQQAGWVLPRRCGLGRCGAALLRTRCAAEEAGEIGQPHFLRRQLGGQLRQCAERLQPEGAGEVALADRALEAAEAEDARLVVEIARKLVRRRRRQRHAEQGEQGGHVGARQAHPQTRTAERLRFQDAALDLQPGIAVPGLQIDRIGLGRIAQAEQRAAEEATRDRLAGVAAVDHGQQRVLAAVLRGYGLHRHPEVRLQRAVDQVQPAVEDAQHAQFGCEGGACVGRWLLARRQLPVAVAGGAAMQVKVGAVDLDLGDQQASVPEAGEVDAYAKRLDAAGALPGRETLGIGDLDALGDQQRAAGEIDVEMVEPDFATQGRRGLAFHQRAKPVPVPEQPQHHQGRHDERADQREAVTATRRHGRARSKGPAG